MIRLLELCQSNNLLFLVRTNPKSDDSRGLNCCYFFHLIDEENNAGIDKCYYSDTLDEICDEIYDEVREYILNKNK